MSVKIKKIMGILAVLITIFLFSGCQAASDVTSISAETAQKVESSEENVESLKQENEIPEDGIITAAQMQTIAGKEGTWYFDGKTDDGIAYQWAYEGDKIQNPEDQKLAVDFFTDGMEEIQGAAGNAPYGLGMKLQKMNLAAPATLTVTLTDQWEADKVLVCLYEDDTIYQLDEAQIEEVKSEKEVKTSLTFQVTQTGKTLYLLGGSVKGTQETDEETSDQEQKQQNNTSDTADTQQQDTPQENQDVPEESTPEEETIHTCTISIECSTILDNWDDLNTAKAEFVPADGWILYSSEVEYTPGESVFDVLKRVCADSAIHMSSRYTPVYGSYYIEGINQLYEFDCGENSGWMYSVNGWYPNYGCSSYTVNDGDNIEWKYTCDLGSDIGGGY